MQKEDFSLVSSKITPPSYIYHWGFLYATLIELMFASFFKSFCQTFLLELLYTKLIQDAITGSLGINLLKLKTTAHIKEHVKILYIVECLLAHS